MAEQSDHGTRVMIADGDPVSAQVLERILRLAGYQVIAVRDGRQALAQIHSEQVFDAILVDWTMPHIDGVELIGEAKLRVDPRPVILIVSALGSEKARERAIAAGADAYIVRPLIPDVVLGELAAALQKRAIDASRAVN